MLILVILLNKLVLLHLLPHSPEGWPELDLTMEAGAQERVEGDTYSYSWPGTGSLALPLLCVGQNQPRCRVVLAQFWVLWEGLQAHTIEEEGKIGAVFIVTLL